MLIDLASKRALVAAKPCIPSEIVLFVVLMAKPLAICALWIFQRLSTKLFIALSCNYFFLQKKNVAFHLLYMLTYLLGIAIYVLFGMECYLNFFNLNFLSTRYVSCPVLFAMYLDDLTIATLTCRNLLFICRRYHVVDSVSMATSTYS